MVDSAVARRWIVPLGLGAAVSVVTLVLLPSLAMPALALLVLVGGVAVVLWPDLATLCVIGLVYSNLPNVAVQFHGAPSVLPAAVLALLGWPFLFRLVMRRESLCLDSALPFVFGLLVIQLASALQSRERETGLAQIVSFLLEGCALYVIVTNVVRTRRLLHASLWTLALCGALMGGVPMLQQITGRVDSNFGGLAQIDSAFEGGETAEEGVRTQHRSAGTIGEQNRYAQFMLLLVPIGISLAAQETSRTARTLGYVTALLALIGAALAFSRGAAVGCVLAVGLALWLKLLSARQVRFLVLAGCVTIVLLPQYLIRIASLSSVVGAATTSGGMARTDGAVRGRLTEMGAAAMVFRDHLLLGVGPGAFGSYVQEYGQIIGLRPLDKGRQSHCLPLDIAAETGILGLVTFGAMLLVVGRRLYFARQTAIARNDLAGTQFTTAILFAGLIFLTTSLFLHMSYIRYFWLLVALADCAAAIVAQGDRGADLLPGWPVPRVRQSPSTSALSV